MVKGKQGMLVSMVQDRPTPKNNANPAANSAAYSFDGIVNTTASGTPFQIIYGTHRAGGHVVNMYLIPENYSETVTVGSDPIDIIGEVLYAQIGVCEGEIESLTEVEIDNLPINYYNAVSSAPDVNYIRLGTPNQTAMPAFNHVESTLSYTSKIPRIPSPPTPAAPIKIGETPVYGVCKDANTILTGPFRFTWVDVYIPDSQAG
jgi:hypothetical protein